MTTRSVTVRALLSNEDAALKPGMFLNVTLAEQPNGDFGRTIVRQFLLDAWQLEAYEALLNSTDTRLASIAAKAIKETRYHFRFSSGWLVRLGGKGDACYGS